MPEEQGVVGEPVMDSDISVISKMSLQGRRVCEMKYWNV
jgi:hypothetical protein